MGSDGRVRWLLQKSAVFLGCDKLDDGPDAATSQQALESFLAGGAPGVLIYARREPTKAPEQPPPQEAAPPAAQPSRSATPARNTIAEELPKEGGVQQEPAAELPAADQAGLQQPAEEKPGAEQPAEQQPGSQQQEVERAGRVSSTPEADVRSAAAAAAAAATADTAAAAAPPAAAPPAVKVPEPDPVLGASIPPYAAAALGHPCVFFSRRGWAPGAQPLQQEEMEAALSYVALPSGPTVDSLKQVLLQVVCPWLSRQSAGAAGPAGGRAAAGLGELLSATQKLTGQLEQAAKQLSISVQLPVPQGVNLSDPDGASKNEEALAVCEQVQEQWVRMMTNVIQQEAQRAPQGRGPLAELTFWQERSAVYSRLFEQLSLPIVKTVQTVVEKGSMDHNLVSSFKSQLSDLTRLTLEARDNVKFMVTLERHFKNISAGSLQSVADTLHPMLNGLRMIWIISRYYGDDIRMSNLLERISQGLTDRLYAAVSVAALFKAPPAQSVKLVKTCKAIAEGYYTTYMEMRQKIEDSGHDARWEFSKQLLFENTHYAAEVCDELLAMLEAVDDFQKFLSPELKAVTGDATVVDEVARKVQAMVAPVEGAAFNVLSKEHRGDWKATRMRFQRDAEDVKAATRDLIDTCFRKLRSVEAAAHLLQSFKRIQTQGAIQRQMQDKLTDVLAHFLKEIEAVRKTFEDSKENPPLTRNMPPVAGAIRWARALFGRVKRTMRTLQSLEADLEASEMGQKAMAACKDLARAMLQYEKQRYEDWRATAESVATSGLQQPVLCRETPTEDEFFPSTGPVRIIINLSPSLLRLVREAKYLDQLGFRVPEAAVHAALQERRLRAHVEELRAMLAHFYKAIDSLHSIERILLTGQVAALEEVLQAGLTRINWNSLSISDFAVTADKAVEEFEALVAQIKKNTASLDKLMHQIATGPLVPPDAQAQRQKTQCNTAAAAAAGDGAAGSSNTKSDGEAAVAGAGAGSGGGGEGGGDAGAQQAQQAGETAAADRVPDMQEFGEEYEQYRLQAIEGLVQKYRAIPALLMKIEELVVGSSTGKAPKLAGYYAYWEHRVFAAINSMVLGAIESVHSRLRACYLAKDVGRKPPVLAVTLSLIHPEIVLTPSTGEVTKQVVRTLRNLAESSKAFVRWMDGTCLECPEQYIYGDDNEPFVFSFFQDISQSPAVIKAMLGVNHTVQKGATALTKYAEGWKKHGYIWKADRAALLAKFKARRPGHGAFEQKLAQYLRVAEDVLAMPQTCDVDFVRVNCAPLLGAVREEACAWLHGIADMMRGFDTPVQQVWEGRLGGLQAGVEVVPTTEEEVDKVKATLLEAVLVGAEAETACADLEERARTRLLYNAGSDAGPLQAELDAICQLRASWKALAARAAERQQQGIELPPPPEQDPALDAAGATPSELAAAAAAGGESLDIGLDGQELGLPGMAGGGRAGLRTPSSPRSATPGGAGPSRRTTAVPDEAPELKAPGAGGKRPGSSPGAGSRSASRAGRATTPSNLRPQSRAAAATPPLGAGASRPGISTGRVGSSNAASPSSSGATRSGTSAARPGNSSRSSKTPSRRGV